jgi:hypothetical protein
METSITQTSITTTIAVNLRGNIMIRHLISMVLSCWAVLGFMHVTEGTWGTIDWFSVGILYGSVIPISVWITMLVIREILSEGGDRR